MNLKCSQNIKKYHSHINGAKKLTDLVFRRAKEENLSKGNHVRLRKEKTGYE